MDAVDEAVDAPVVPLDGLYVVPLTDSDVRNAHMALWLWRHEDEWAARWLMKVDRALTARRVRALLDQLLLDVSHGVTRAIRDTFARPLTH